MLNKELEITLNHTYKDARVQRHEFITVEHLLLALIDNGAAVAVLRACGADCHQLRGELELFIQETAPVLPLTHHTFLHYLYAPFAGFTMAFGVGLQWVFARWPGAGSRSSTPTGTVTA